MATARTAERGVMRKRSVAGGLGIGTYSTDVAEPDPGSTPPPSPPLPVRVVDLDWRSVATVLAAFVGLVALTGFVRSVPRSAAALGVATVVALALEPVVARVTRVLCHVRLGRASAVIATLSLLSGTAAVVMVLVVPPGVRQARELSGQLPRVVRQLDDLPLVGNRLQRADAAGKLQRGIEQLPDRLAGDAAPLERAARHVADGVLAAIVTALLAVTMMLDGPRLLAAARRLVPERRRPQADDLARLASRVVGHYVAGSLLVAGFAGLVVLVAGLAAGVPLTPLAAVWVSVWDLVPQIGGAAGGIPFVLLGLTHGAGTAVVCAVVMLVYQQVKHQVLQPVLVGQAVKLSPPTTMVAALVGVSAGGVVGALLAVPLVGAAKAVYIELRYPAGYGRPA